jgi:hypothetical protein
VFIMRVTRVRFVLGVATAVLCTPIFVAVAAASDVGNGSASCGRGEMCYSKDYPSSLYQRDYYYSGNDTAAPSTFQYVSSPYWTNVPVLNHASSVNNRHTSCKFLIVDWNDAGTQMVNSQEVSVHPDSTSWVPLKSVLNDRNDAHLRCGHY